MREMPEAKLVVVQAFNKEWEAEMAKSALKAAGIDAMIRADSVGGTRPHVAWASGGFKLLVLEENAAAARGVLEAPKKRA
jgi:Putative prokaryotic signal transducing protein